MKVNMERLYERAYSIAIMDFPSYSTQLSSIEIKSSLSILANEWPETKANYGVETLIELITFELSLPRPKSYYKSLSEEEIRDFWLKVNFLNKLLPG